MNATTWRSASIIILLSAAFLLAIASLWVPINFSSYDAYREVSLFTGLKSRALLGTLAQLFRLGPVEFNLLVLGTLYCWLSMLLYQLYRSLFATRKTSLNSTMIFVGLGYIFSISTVTVITYSSAGFIDVVPYSLVACAALLSERITPAINIKLIAGISLLLILGVMSHEKTLFDLGILATWICWKLGFRQMLINMMPATMAAIVFLMSVPGEGSAGLSPSEYLDILLSGLSFLNSWSFNLWGILAGGGALWILYPLLARPFIDSANDSHARLKRTVTVVVMLALCLLPLLVAADTNRMVGVIWLPVFLLLGQVDLGKVFHGPVRTAGLIGLCMYQFAIPPALIYSHGIIPFNCYSLAIVNKLPKEADIVPQLMGPFGLYEIARANRNRPWRQECSGLTGK
ncbi:MAG: hypothetical protein GY746_17230 [Gammaproteobacteria bacterium]|nr:hypothetical protein [Gammaproteobacteria bacterium]MCP4275420.1 hypothetical protein [Gammaproteobacteria bacterium]MCP4832308.1 hypothetical protein [Gammaproteobacteria bacterium]